MTSTDAGNSEHTDGPDDSPANPDCAPVIDTAAQQSGAPSGGGVLIARYTSLRIPAGGLTISVNDQGQIEMSPLVLEVTLDTWPHWLSVGLDHLRNADTAHQDLLAAHAAGDEVAKHDALEREFRSSMQAITSAAFAVDALYGSITVVSPATAPGRTRSRPAAVMSAIQRVAKVTNAQAKTLSHGLSQVFEFRNWAVHPPRDFRAPRLHPDLHVGVDWRFVAFKAENAHAALSIAIETITRAVDRPRGSGPVLEWSRSQADILQQVLADNQVNVAPTRETER